MINQKDLTPSSSWTDEHTVPVHGIAEQNKVSALISALAIYTFSHTLEQSLGMILLVIVLQGFCAGLYTQSISYCIRADKLQYFKMFSRISMLWDGCFIMTYDTT